MTTQTEIQLSGGHVAVVDDVDCEMLSRLTWSADADGRTAYAVRARTCRRGGGNVFMHRMIMLPDPDQDVHHINGDGLDNRRCNLRVCSHAENRRHNRRYANSTSGFKGVSWNKKSGRFEAYIAEGGVQHHFGHFSTPEEAAAAYDAAAHDLHGEFAHPNHQRS